MAVTLEQVEKLREKSGATYEACKDALDRTDGDLLEAMIFLERTGRSRTAPRGGTFTTERGGGVDEAAKLVLETQPAPGKKKKHNRGEDYREWFREVWAAGLNLLRHSTVNQFEVWRQGRLMTSIPILILVLLIIVAFWISVPLLIIGLFIGCRYRFVGPDLGKESINDVMDNVSATVDDMVGQVKKEFRDGRDSAGPKASRPEETARHARETAEKAARKAQESAGKAARKAQESAEKAARKTQEATEKAARKAREAAGQAGRKAQDTAEKAARKAEDLSGKLDGMVDSICGHVDNLVSRIDQAISDKKK